MKTLKDKRKFGGNSLIRKNRRKHRGVQDGKEYRKILRKNIKAVRHKLLKGIPLTNDEAYYAHFYIDYSIEYSHKLFLHKHFEMPG